LIKKILSTNSRPSEEAKIVNQKRRWQTIRRPPKKSKGARKKKFKRKNIQAQKKKLVSSWYEEGSGTLGRLRGRRRNISPRRMMHELWALVTNQK